MITQIPPAMILTSFLAAASWMAAVGPVVLAQTPTVEPGGQGAEESFARFVRARWVLLDEANGLDGAIGTFDSATGKLNPRSGMRVDLYNANAVRVHRVTTESDGQFRIPSLAGGLYQVVAQSNSGVLAFSLFAIERGQPTGRTITRDATILVQAPRRTADRLDIVSAAVPPTFTQLNAILRLYYGRTTPAYLGRNGVSATAASGAENRLRDDLMPQDDEPEARASASAIRAHDVLLSDDNRMVGRLFTMHADDGAPGRIGDVYVHIIRDDQLIGPPIPVNEDGVFQAELFDGPGAYSIVVAGSGGFGACGFYARRIDAIDRGPPLSVTLASVRIAQREPADEMAPPAAAARDVAPPYQFTMSVIGDPRVWQQAFPAAGLADALAGADSAMPAGGFAVETAPLAGGGALGAGGGVARALLLGGGLAAGITALATDDNGRGQRLVSPFVP